MPTVTSGHRKQSRGFRYSIAGANRPSGCASVVPYSGSTEIEAKMAPVTAMVPPMVPTALRRA